MTREDASGLRRTAAAGFLVLLASLAGCGTGRDRTRVRLIGIDTPEVASPQRPAECWGAEASRAAERLLEGERVEVRLDATQGRYDDYGRTLAGCLPPCRGRGPG